MINTIYVMSKGKPDTASTYAWFKKYNFKNYVTILCMEDNRAKYLHNYGGKYRKAPRRITNLSRKREWSLNRFTKPNNWMLMMCDNVLSVKAVDLGIENPTKQDFEREISPQELLTIANKNAKHADFIDANLFGFASNSNHFFRKKHFREVGFVWGKIVGMKRDGMKWEHSQNDMDDYVSTAESLKHCGKVWIDNYVYAHSKRFEKIGGNGSYEKRVAGKIKAAKFLVENYGGLFRYKNRPGLVPKSEVQMRFTSTMQVAGWRTEILSRYSIKSIKQEFYART